MNWGPGEPGVHEHRAAMVFEDAGAYTGGKWYDMNNDGRLHYCVCDAAPAPACSDGEVRPAKGAVAYQGSPFYPEIYYGGSWYPVCGHYFWDDSNGATTLCQMMGFSSRAAK